ncbi:MAG: DMT family transporter [Treponema sp.]|nr:DMT family transporter [Treponema sp.]
MSKNNRFTGILFASTAIFIWGITFVSTKYLLRSFSAFEILIIRFLLAYCSLWLISPRLLHTGGWKNELYFVLAGFTGVTAYQLMENMAIAYTSASNVSILVSICPVFTAIFMQIFLKEKHLTVWFNVGFLLAISGVALVSFNGVVQFHLNPKGDFLALAAAVSWGAYSLCVAKINALGFDSVHVTRRIFFWALVFMFITGIWSLLTSGSSVPSGPEQQIPHTAVILDLTFNKLRFSQLLNWLNLCFLGIGASAFCFAAWNIACEKLGTVNATAGLYLIPVVTIIFAYFALGEKLSLMGAAGALIAIAGVFVSERKSA